MNRRHRSIAKALVAWLTLGLLFTLNFLKTPLYSSNETTKLFHGLVASQGGSLASDWLVTTTDPLPAFSTFVRLSHSLFGEGIFYAYYAALCATFLYSIIAIFRPNPIRLLDASSSREERDRALLFLTGLFLFFSPFLGNIIEDLIGTNYLGVLSNGVARQYLVDSLFQNSLFGVLLVTAVAFFVRRRRTLAAVFIAVACTIHSAYLFLGAAITVGMIAEMVRKKEPLPKVVQFAALTLVLVLPIVWYNRLVFSATTPAIQEEAMHLLVFERIPHHALPEVWFSRRSVIKSLVVVLAIVVNRRRTIGLVLLFPLLFGVAGTMLQVATRSTMLALVAPWRVSVFLMPLSMAALIHTMVEAGYSLLSTRASRFVRYVPKVSILLLILVGASSAYLQVSVFDPSLTAKEHDLYSFVRLNGRDGDLYVIPPRVDALNDFRIRTGTPIVINWKSHPYKDVELLEWYERNQRLERFYTATTLPEALIALESVRKLYAPTALVIPVENLVAGRALSQSGAELVFRNDRYAVFKLQSISLQNAG